MSSRVIPDDLHQNITTDRRNTKDSQDFKRDDGGVRYTPTEVRLTVLFPCVVTLAQIAQQIKPRRT
jgi:hypothetical protein